MPLIFGCNFVIMVSRLTNLQQPRARNSVTRIAWFGDDPRHLPPHCLAPAERRLLIPPDTRRIGSKQIQFRRSISSGNEWRDSGALVGALTNCTRQ